MEDWQARYERYRQLPEFEQIREKYREVVEEERPEDAEIFNSDYRAFCEGFEQVRKAYFSNTNPETVARTRAGDVDAACRLLEEMGVVGRRGFED